MTITRKPKAIFKNGQWMCWTPAIFGSRIVGTGKTLEQAMADHKEAVQRNKTKVAA